VATIRFPLDVGCLVRGAVRRDLKRFCYQYGYDLSLEEDRGLLSSLFFVKIEVPSDKVDEVSKAIDKWVKANNQE
jgi:hypothetical protein